MRRRHSSHVSASPGAEASVKAARFCAPRSGRSALTDAEAEGTSPRVLRHHVWEKPRARKIKVPPKCHRNHRFRWSAFVARAQAIYFIEDLVALPGLEPGLFALRGRRVNQLHHNAKTAYSQEAIFSSASIKYSKQQPRTQGSNPIQYALYFNPKAVGCLGS